MRELIMRLLPESSVLGVPGVPKNESPQKTRHDLVPEVGTPDRGSDVAGVLSATIVEHWEHHVQNEMFLQIDREIKTRTPRTPGTLNFLEAYQERAAIMEFDGGMSRQEAEAAAFQDCASLCAEYKL